MLPDYLAEGLEIVFIGLNPGTYSDKRGHYFARSTNLFWTALYEAGLVTERLKPEDDVRLNDFGYGLTDLVPRATPNIDTLTREEFVAGGEILCAKIERYQPKIACFVGITGFRSALNRRAALGAQASPQWGATKLFIVPSTSPRNAYYRPHVIAWFKQLKEFRDNQKGKP
jgi:TDG/mug DNA glycosylase family protein